MGIFGARAVLETYISGIFKTGCELAHLSNTEYCVLLLLLSLQSCPTLCDPIDGSPPGFPVPGILQARTLEWVAISFSNAWKWKVKVKSLSRVRPSGTPWTAAFQAPPPMGFSRQEYWSGVPLPSPTVSYSQSFFHFSGFVSTCISKMFLPDVDAAASWTTLYKSLINCTCTLAEMWVYIYRELMIQGVKELILWAVLHAIA